LLVEDNELNREVALGLLEDAHLAIDTAENGRVAVEMVTEHEYELVLMDMQMPVMDGLAAARAIRSKPQFQSLPIIAMTANVMESDRDRCAEAGMNDHLAKPIDPDALFAALLRWIKPRTDVAAKVPPEPAAAIARSPEPAGPPETATLQIKDVDTQSALRRTGGNPKRYEMLLRKFAESANVEEIHAALDAGDTATAARAAHSLKGAAANLGAAAVANSAAEAETAIKAGQPVQPLLDTLATHLHAVVQAIRSVLPNEQLAQSAVSAAADPAAVASPLRNLKKLLSNDDGDAADFILEAQPDLAKALTGSEISSLSDFVSNYDFVGALKCVAAIANRLGLKLE
jgi:two-component system sensor histidine kinase/response regulator